MMGTCFRVPAAATTYIVPCFTETVKRLPINQPENGLMVHGVHGLCWACVCVITLACSSLLCAGTIYSVAICLVVNIFVSQLEWVCCNCQCILRKINACLCHVLQCLFRKYDAPFHIYRNIGMFLLSSYLWTLCSLGCHKQKFLLHSGYVKVYPYPPSL